jgi:hypothetical protein
LSSFGAVGRTRATGAGAVFSMGVGLAAPPLNTFENQEGMMKFPMPQLSV